jgi:hypothetical protein
MEDLANVVEYHETIEHMDLNVVVSPRAFLPEAFLDHHLSRIGYYCGLRSYGRGKARDSETTSAEFVELLLQLSPGTSDYDQLIGDRILYGLLGENPSVWACNQR